MKMEREKAVFNLTVYLKVLTSRKYISMRHCHPFQTVFLYIAILHFQGYALKLPQLN